MPLVFPEPLRVPLLLLAPRHPPLLLPPVPLHRRPLKFPDGQRLRLFVLCHPHLPQEVRRTLRDPVRCWGLVNRYLEMSRPARRVLP